MRALCALLLVLLAACGPGSQGESLVVYNAGSLARPMRAVMDSFARREDVRVEQESAGSLETARKLTELGKIPDIVALADVAVFPEYLVPDHVDEYLVFARNRMVVAFTPVSRYAEEISPANWPEILGRADVEVGRADPQLDPNGYRTLMVWQLAAATRRETRLPPRLLARAPARNVRPKEADLVGLLQAGEFDYIWSYESMARGIGLRYVLLGDSVDLSQPALSEFYRTARVTVRGAGPADSVTFVGTPIAYAVAIPRAAPHRALADRFLRFVLSDEGRAILRREGLDALDAPMTQR